MNALPRTVPLLGAAGPLASVVLALGSNLGDRSATLAEAVQAIADVEGLELTGVSELYESAAVKVSGVDHTAPRYLNGVATASYRKDPYTLLAALNRIEAEHGRERTERWGDRTLDIDIVTFGDLDLHDERLIIPHPRAALRDFVLVPWLQLDPAARLPGHGRVADLVASQGSTVQPFRGEAR